MEANTEVVEQLPVELLKIRTGDGHVVTGAYASGTKNRGIVVIHGKTGDFNSGVNWFTLKNLNRLGYHVLSLSMRCYGLGHAAVGARPVGFLRTVMEGGAWEDITVGHHDLQAAVATMHSKGVENVTLMGQSSGGYYLADYVSREIGGIDSLVFSAPLLSNNTAPKLWFPTESAREEAYRAASQMVQEGRGDDLIHLPLWYYVISAKSLVQRMDEPDGVALEMMKNNTLPLLLVCGSLETRVEAWRDAVSVFGGEKKHFVVLDDADHSFVDHEDDHSQAVFAFLATLD